MIDQTRRFFLSAGAASAALLVASCRSILPSMDGQGASRDARSHLAGIRSGAGLALLTPDSRLEKAALEQSRYMAAAGRMAHTAVRGRDFEARMRRAEISAPAAENLAHGRMPMGRVFEMWMESDGHRRNMLDPRFTRYGLAHVEESEGRKYWTLVLGV